MADQEPHDELSFVELASYRAVTTDRRKIGGNVIKAKNVAMTGVLQVGAGTDPSDQPTVTIHREGEKILGAEFLCKCGRCAVLEFDYEGE